MWVFSAKKHFILWVSFLRVFTYTESNVSQRQCVTCQSNYFASPVINQDMIGTNRSVTAIGDHCDNVNVLTRHPATQVPPVSRGWIRASERRLSFIFILVTVFIQTCNNIWPLSAWSPASPVNVTLPETDTQWCQMSDVRQGERGLTQSLERQVWLRIWGVIVVTFLLCHLWCVPGLSHNSVRDLWQRD